MNLDFLTFAAHPDDAELSMGGTIAKMINKGKSFGIIDLTQGELGTRGSKETRKEEAAEASRILGITIRENLGFPDGNIFVNEENTLKIIEIIRKYRPSIIFSPYFNDRHPDHIEASKLIKRAMFFSGLPKIETKIDNQVQAAFRPKKLFYFIQTYEFNPTFIIDISDTFDTKMKSMKAYKTQFHNEEVQDSGPKTFISDPEFLKYLEARSKTFGFKIGKKYGEPFFSEEAIELDLQNYLDITL
ncbi:MAG: bacillithiol biosynthesis deacetylase BshB1 [Melioribacteraceae bacterium]|nr:bacillithiol biosynthesis deacetylase BshB1 [Melioribacteraceae bacterium]